jgi:DNA-binding protein H-NS
VSAINKLIGIRERLSKLTESVGFSDKSAREQKTEKEIKAAVQALDEVIAHVQHELQTLANQEAAAARELQRTTAQPIQPPAQPGPHEVTWKKPNDIK